MAGTGHNYEIVNLHEVHSFLEERGRHLRTDATKTWIKSPKVIKYFTQEKFTTEVSIENFDHMLDVFDHEDIPHLKRKAENGETLRYFTKERVDSIGPDLPHIIDWLIHIETSNGDRRVLNKLHKMGVEQVELASKTWTSWEPAIDVTRGREEVVFDAEEGMLWVELLDAQSLKAEGSLMNHCVGSYRERLDSDQYRIFSLRDKKNNNSIVTVSIEQNRSGEWWLDQAKGRWNTPVPSHCEQSLADLLNHLGIVSHQDLSGTGIVYEQGRWDRVINVRKEIEWLGHKCYVNGSNIIIMSNYLPGLYLAEVILSKQMEDIEHFSDEKAIFKIQGIRHLHIEEQRSIARMMNTLGTSSTSGTPYMFTTDENDTIIPIIDKYERMKVGGVECILKPRKEHDHDSDNKHYDIQVPHSRDLARILVTFTGENTSIGHYTENSPKFYGASAALIHDPARLNATESERFLSVMNEIKTATKILNASSNKIAFDEWMVKYMPQLSHRDGKWFFMSIDGIREPAIIAGQGSWISANGIAKFISDDNEMILYQGGDNELLYSPMPFYDTSLFEEAVSYLNKHKWEPSQLHFWKTTHFHSRLHMSSSGEHRKIYYLHGKWRVANTEEELIKAYMTKLPRKRKHVFTAAESAAILNLLPLHHVSDDLDDVISVALNTWIKKTKNKEFLEIMPMIRDNVVDAILRLNSKFSPSVQNKSRKYLGKLFLQKIKDKKKMYFGDDLEDYYLKLYRHLNHKDFAKATKSIWRLFRVRHGERSPNPELFHVYQYARSISEATAHQILSEMIWTLFHFKPDDAFKDEGLQYEQAVEWVNLAEICQHHHSGHFIGETCGKLLSHMKNAHVENEGQQQDWDQLISRMEAVYDIVGDSEKFAQRKRLEEEERNRKWLESLKNRNLKSAA